MNKILSFAFLFAVLIFAACQQAATDKSAAPSEATIKTISVEEAHAAVKASNAQFIDVRTAEEYSAEHAQQAINLPLDTLEQNLNKLDKNKPVYLICQTGRRSQKGAEILQKAGFTSLYNVEGGTGAWTAAKLPTEPVSGN